MKKPKTRRPRNQPALEESYMTNEIIKIKIGKLYNERMKLYHGLIQELQKIELKFKSGEYSLEQYAEVRLLEAGRYKRAVYPIDTQIMELNKKIKK